jgi:hypothetical protein
VPGSHDQRERAHRILAGGEIHHGHERLVEMVESLVADNPDDFPRARRELERHVLPQSGPPA